jgi:hypothetical protein
VEKLKDYWDIPISNKRWSMYISFRLMLMRKYFY